MRSKYEPLKVFLENRPRNDTEVKLTFDEIENILDARLPRSAWDHREWWSNQKDVSTRPQAKAWIEAGYKVKELDQSRNLPYVCFKRA